jgi:hypothetical protein
MCCLIEPAMIDSLNVGFPTSRHCLEIIMSALFKRPGSITTLILVIAWINPANASVAGIAVES